MSGATKQRAFGGRASGRGVGLDLTLGMVRRLGGSVRVRSRRRRGFEAVIDVPTEERGVVPILLVRSLGHRFALSARRVLRVRLLEAPEPIPSLACCIVPTLTGDARPAFAIEVGRPEADEEPVALSVDDVQGVEQAMVRPVPPLVAAAGPYVGVLNASDGMPAMLVDVLLIADRLRARDPSGLRTPPPPGVRD